MSRGSWRWLASKRPDAVQEGRIRIHNLYADADGETHFRDIEVEGAIGQMPKRLPATGIIFAEATGDYYYESHPAPCRQYVITLDDGMEVTGATVNTASSVP